MSTHTPHRDLPPPITNVGVIGWLRTNLFSSWLNGLLTLVAAFVTQDPIDFYEQTLDERDVNGNVNVEFTTLSHVATRAIRVAERKEEMHAAYIDLMVITDQKE